MASDPGFAEYVCEQLGAAGDIASRRMFGEYAIYSGPKVIGLVCDNQFFLKPTTAGRASSAMSRSPPRTPAPNRTS